MVAQQFPTFSSSLRHNNNWEPLPQEYSLISHNNWNSSNVAVRSSNLGTTGVLRKFSLIVSLNARFESNFFSSSSLSLDNFIPTHCRRRGYCCTLAHSKTHPHSVGLLWTSDQPVAKTSTWQHTTIKRDRERHPCPRRDSKPQSQHVSGSRNNLSPRDHRDRPKDSVKRKIFHFCQE